MKRLFLAAALMILSAGIARADQVDIYPGNGLGNLHQYRELANASGVPLNAVMPQTNIAGGGMEAWFDDQVQPITNSFYSVWLGTWNGNGIESTLQKCVYDLTQWPVPACTFNGETIEVTLNEYTTKKRTTSGRGQGIYTQWHLTGGTLVRADPPAPADPVVADDPPPVDTPPPCDPTVEACP